VVPIKRLDVLRVYFDGYALINQLNGEHNTKIILGTQENSLHPLQRPELNAHLCASYQKWMRFTLAQVKFGAQRFDLKVRQRCRVTAAAY
jgi:hypothetical protein